MRGRRNRDEALSPELASPEAEIEVLGAMLIDSSQAIQAARLLSVNDFTVEVHREVYRSIANVIEEGEPCELANVATDMRRRSLPFDSTVLASLMQKCIAPSQCMYYARKVAAISLSREMARAAKSITERAGEMDPAKLMLEAGRVVRDIESRMALLSMSESPAIVTFADIEKEIGEVTWLWHKWIPAGLITLVAGTDGVGKSKLLMRIAQCVISEGMWPDGQKVEIPNGSKPEVMFIDTEGSQAVNLQRLKQLGIPLEKVYWFKDPRSDDKMRDIKLDDSTSWETLVRTVVIRRPAIVMFDALRGLFRGDENSSKDVTFLERIAALGRDTKSSMVLTHHVRKSQPGAEKGVIEKDDIRGAGAIRQWCRSIIGCDTPDENTTKIRVRSLKSTLSEAPPPLGMIHEGNIVTFDGAPPQVPRKETLTDRAAEFLLNSLRKGSTPQRELREMAEAAGFTWATVMRAKDRLGINSVPMPRVEGVKGAQPYIWSLPVRLLPNGNGKGD